ncbi:MAG TPA: DUF998 domain-containing protein [Thermoanaerobaculia bacterium]|nr:DUF998 domain-containing protein [Thermoanaerobaculia bacterium]
MRLEKSLLNAGIAVPLIYFGNLILTPLFYPGYSHVTQYASELGGPDAPRPYIFNTAILLLGVAGLVAGAGFFLGLRRLTGKTLLPVLLGLILVLFGVSMVMGGLFPMPDERHGGFGLGMGVHLGPLLLALALRKRPNLRGLQVYLLITTVLMIAFFAIMMGVGELVTRANVGIFQRLYALNLFPWIGIGAWFVKRELERAG